jgi:hypothetical protein
MDDPPIPQCLEAALPFGEVQLQNLKECLFLTANSPDCFVQVVFTLQERVAVQPIDGVERSFAIVELGYSLHHQKENM